MTLKALKIITRINLVRGTQFYKQRKLYKKHFLFKAPFC